MAVEVSDVPESLQNCCFMKLINDFETFPPESLALLPLRLRHELIQNLPAVDVCQLEQSSFVEGLDMEEVWAAIVKKCGLGRGRVPSQSKDKFFADIYRIMFNGCLIDHQQQSANINRLVRLLFCSQLVRANSSSKDLEMVPRSKLKDSFLEQLPLRYRKYFGLSLNLADRMRLVLEKTYYHPKALKIYANHIEWFFLTRKKSPWLKGGDYHHLVVEYLSEVSYLDINDGGRNERVILFIMPIIESQSFLHRLRLVVGYRLTSHGVSHLCTILAGLWRQPQFCDMNLLLSMPSNSLQEIIHSFIAIPCSSNCSLHLRGHITEVKNSRKLSCPDPPQENVLHKTLILGSYLPDSVLRWLHKHVVLRLKELCLQGLQYARSPAPILNHPKMEVERLSLIFSKHSEQNFDHLLQNSHLKHLSIDMVEMPSLQIITGLAHGFHKRTQLELLRLRYFSSQFSPSEMAPLYEAIVSLPQLENFTLDISDPHAAEMLYEVWKKKADGRKFKSLIITYVIESELKPDVSFLQDITREFHYCVGHRLAFLA